MRYRNEVMGDHSGSVRAEGWFSGLAKHLTKHGFLFCVDAHRHGERFIVEADDLLTAFVSRGERRDSAKGANGNATGQNVA